MVAIKNLLFLVTAVTALNIGKRDTATILSDIATIKSNVQKLTTAANAYNGGLLAAIPILTAQNNVESALDKATTDAKATAQQTSAQSAQVVAAVDNFIPDTEASINAIVAKKAKFTADGIAGTVRTSLVNLKAKSGAFSDALIAIASADTKATGAAQKARVDKDFDDAIALFA